MANQEVTKDEARALVKEIAEERGFIDEEDWEQVPLRIRQKLQAAYLKKDVIITKSLVQLSQNLYSSSARFVFELLQNADDNRYTKARARGDVPYVSFNVTPNKVIFECNEDGFTPNNLRAICSVGESSKTEVQGYIGNKGIGFKSVFMVAWKIYIQSGNFSFNFQHKKGDPGLNMITPRWVESEEPLPKPLTRMTLYLYPTDKGSEDDAVIRTQKALMFEQFRELQKTMLLFMRNIRRIHVRMCDEQGIDSTTIYTMKTDAEGLVSLDQKTTRHDSTANDTTYFHVTKHIASGLSKHETRTYTDADLKNRAYSTAEIILAFPVTAASVPVIENQWLYAFLPLKPFHFSFLIHADFETLANRQDITTSARNLELMDGIATAFLNAISQFNRHPSLRYQWMRYLPQRTGLQWGEQIWVKLIELIANKMGQTALLYQDTIFSRNQKLQMLKSLRYLQPIQLDRRGRPLFHDSWPALYIGAAYEQDDLSLLRPYGLPYLSISELLNIVRGDLTIPDSSRMMAKSTDDNWHSRAAKLLRKLFEISSPRDRQTLKSLKLIPLSDCNWGSMEEADGPALYPEIHGVLIPGDIGLRILDPEAVQNQDRVALFDKLGVQIADVEGVRSHLISRYIIAPKWPLQSSLSEPSLPRCPSTLSSSISHLQFLYLTEHLIPREDDLTSLEIFIQDGTLRQPATHPVYVADNSRYGAYELLRPMANAPGLKVSMLHEDYLRHQPQKPEKQKLTWLEWLYKALKLRPRLRITELDSSNQLQLTRTCLYLAEHRRERILGFLKSQWKFERGKIVKSPEIIALIGKIQLSTTRGVDLSLGKSYLPTKDAKKLVAAYLCPEEHFPWIPLDPDEEFNPSEWEVIMKDLKTGFSADNIDFGLCMLNCIVYGTYGQGNLPELTGLPKAERIYKLYQHLEYLARQSRDYDNSRQKIHKYFSDNAAIYITPNVYNGACWADIDDCLWSAPSQMKSKYPLAALYEKDHHNKGSDSTYLANFFKSTLGVSNACQEIFIEELEHLRDNKQDDFDDIENIYRELDQIQNLTSKYLGVRNPPVNRKAKRSGVDRPPAPDGSRPSSVFFGYNPGSSHTPSPVVSLFGGGQPLFGGGQPLSGLPNTDSVGGTVQSAFKSPESHAIPSIFASKSTAPSPPIFGQYSGASAVSSADSNGQSSQSPRSHGLSGIFGSKRTTSSPSTSDFGVFGSSGTTAKSLFGAFGEKSASSHFDSRANSGFPLGSSNSGSNATGLESLQHVFSTKALIYVPGNSASAWYKSSDCLWSAATHISGRVALSNDYPDLRDFFVTMLGVPNLTLQMVFDEIKNMDAQKVSVDEIKDKLLVLNSLLKSETSHPDFGEISKREIFPVRKGFQTPQLVSVATDFALIDRQPLYESFAAKDALFLHFDLDDIRHLEPLINWAGLQERYLSISVRENSSIEGSNVTPLSKRSREISTKAHGLLRIAVHFDSPRARYNQQEFYEILRGIKVFEADKISSELRLSQDGHSIRVVKTASELHIDGHGSSPKFYVPHDEKSQRRCYLSLLPRRLLEWMLSDPDTNICEPITDKAIMAVKTILLASRSDVSHILDDEGIMNIATQRIEDESEDDEPLHNGRDDRRDHGQAWSATNWAFPAVDLTETSTSLPVPVVPHPLSSAGGNSPRGWRLGTADTTPEIPTSSFLYSFATSEQARVPRATVERDYENATVTRYRNLLDKAIAAAQSIQFPSHGSFNMEAMASAINDISNESSDDEDDGEGLSVRSPEQRERDFRVGAAGELFVFELLKRLSSQLPGFCEGNWESTIRKYVKIHPSYVNLPDLHVREKADIIYQDVQGTFTAFLADKGYLDSDAWAGKTPKYFIEVKTTTGPCSTRLFMSRSQYKRMKDHSNGMSGRENQEAIYVIFRVYDLGQDRMGLKIYMDPETLRSKGFLSFREDTWSVTPSNP